MLFQNTRRLKPVQFILAFILAVVMTLGSAFVAPVTNASSSTKIVVMLNLEDVTDFAAFDKQMATLKSRGVYGVEVDMWWNHFEPAKGQYDWSYYKNLFTHIQAAGLKIAPIFSFHQCGGNVGDTCNYPIPSWVWDLGTKEEMQFKSESGYYDKEYIAPWFDEAVNLYDGAFQSFASNMTEFKSSFEKFHIGLGPAGELRYPSYNFADNWQYPSRGLFQAYSGAAIADFQSKMELKYKNITALNTAWGTNLVSFSEVQPPANGDSFYSSGDYKKTYGVDFLNWYQGTLENHFTSIITKAHADLDAAFGVPLSAKVPGIHWQYSNPAAPHSAEHATGLYNYSSLLDLYKKYNVDLTFTMLEMTNAANGNGESPNYSKPQDLINDVSELAVQKGIKLEGENALPVGNAEDYQTIYNVVKKYNYDIFTLLRMQDVVQVNGQPTKLLDPFVTTLTLGQLPQQRVSMNIYDPEADPVNAKVFIVGNSNSIGSWNPANAVPAMYLGNGYWQLNMDLKATSTYEFKAIRKDATNTTTWGADPNLTWTVPYIPGGTAVFKADLQRKDQDDTHKHSISGDIILNGSTKAGTTVSLTDANGEVLTANYGEEKQSSYGNYGVIAVANDAYKVKYYFEVPRGTYTLKAVNGSQSAQMTVVANSQTLSGEKLIDKVLDVPLSAPSNSGGGTGSGGGTTPVPSNPGTGDKEQINPTVSAGAVISDLSSAVTVQPGAAGVSQVVLDSNKAIAAIQSGKDNAKAFAITVPEVKGSEAVSVSIPADVSKAALDKGGSGASILVVTSFGEYNLPLKALGSQSLNTIVVTVAQVNDATEKQIGDKAVGKGLTLLGSPTTFTVELVKADGSRQEIENFNNVYVPRSIHVGATIDTSNAVAVKVNADGSLIPVPTYFTKDSTGISAVINRTSNSTYAVVSGNKSFADTKGHWAEATISKMASHLLVNGVTDTKFEPQLNITRAEFTSLVVRALGLSDSAGTSSFKDVKPSDWFYKEVGIAVSAGLIKGEGDQFNPGDNITREQMAAIFERALKFAGTSVPSSTATLSFSDKGSISAWAAPSISAAVQLGILKGDERGMLHPGAPATRAEGTVMLERMLKVIKFINE